MKFICTTSINKGSSIGGVDMWQYRCPVCGKVVREDKSKADVTKIMRRSHKCPECGGTLYVSDKGFCVDLGEMLVRAFELNTGIILSKEEVLSNYYEV